MGTSSSAGHYCGLYTLQLTKNINCLFPLEACIMSLKITRTSLQEESSGQINPVSRVCSVFSNYLPSSSGSQARVTEMANIILKVSESPHQQLEGMLPMPGAEVFVIYSALGKEYHPKWHNFIQYVLYIYVCISK